MQRKFCTAASALVLSMLLAANSASVSAADSHDERGGWSSTGNGHDEPQAKTPIKHLVVIFGENESFDHYFGTYPNAAYPNGVAGSESPFKADPRTPRANNYVTHPELLSKNPNYLNQANTPPTGPFRLDRSQAHTSSQNHGYTAEQEAYDDGKMDLFPVDTGAVPGFGTGVFDTKGIVMGYYDGNTVTAMWNYAQHFALNDNSFSSQFGPSSPGAINVISGQTNGAVGYTGTTPVTSSTGTVNGNVVNDGQGGLTMYSDGDPFGDVCSSTSGTISMTGKNIGDLLNAKHITWGWFEGGFDLTAVNPNGTTGCKRSTVSPVTGLTEADYVPHHQPFQYYASTQNLKHTRPSSIAAIGTSNDGGANHQYDTNDFFKALSAGNLPTVTYLKAQSYQDAHPGNSNPLDEQAFVVNVINALQQSPEWDSTAVVIAYDDSDGWYDHANNVINPSSNSAVDALLSAGKCGPLPGTDHALREPLTGIKGKPVNGRCGYGTRQPLMVISPYSKANFIDHTLTDQSSVVRFIEDNWLDGARIQGSYDAVAGTLDNMFDFHQRPNAKLILDPTYGTSTHD